MKTWWLNAWSFRLFFSAKKSWESIWSIFTWVCFFRRPASTLKQKGCFRFPTYLRFHWKFNTLKLRWYCCPRLFAPLFSKLRKNLIWITKESNIFQSFNPDFSAQCLRLGVVACFTWWFFGVIHLKGQGLANPHAKAKHQHVVDAQNESILEFWLSTSKGDPSWDVHCCNFLADPTNEESFQGSFNCPSFPKPISC